MNVDNSKSALGSAKGDPTKININFDPEVQRMVGYTRQGNFPFDVPFVTEIAPNLFQGGTKTGLIMPKYIKHFVSLYCWEQYKVKHELLSAMTVEMYDSEDQEFDQVEAIAAWVNVCRKSAPTLVVCQAGLNRSSLVVGAALVQSGMTGREAVDLIRQKRSPAALCNTSFANYLLSK